MARPQDMGISFGENMGGRAGMLGSAYQPGEGNLGSRGDKRTALQSLTPAQPLPYSHPPFFAAQRYVRAKLSSAHWELPGLLSSTVEGCRESSG